MINESYGKKLPAKTCYSHLGGKLGVLLLEQFITKRLLAKEKSNDKQFYITAKGKQHLKN